MATKSKNIKYSKGTKTAALLIAVVMFFSSGYFANLFIRGFADYNAYDEGKNHYTHTHTFRELMNTAENYYISDFELDGQVFDSFEEFKESERYQTALADYDALVARVSEAYDILENSEIEVYVNNQNNYKYLYPYKNFVYLFDCSGTLGHEDSFFHSYGDFTRVYPHDEPAEESTTSRIVPSTTAVVELTDADGTSYTAAAVTSPAHTAKSVISNAWIGSDGNGRYQKKGGSELRFYNPGNGQPPLEVQDIGEALQAINAINGYTCYGESTKARFLEEVEANKEQFLHEIYNDTPSHYYDYILDDIKSVNYAIIGYGKVKTNCGVTADDTEAQILEKLGGEFAEASINGTYKLLKSAGENKGASSSLYGKLFQMLFGKNDSILKQSSAYFTDTQNISAYFSYGYDGSVTDPFTLSFRAYQSFTNSSVNDITACLVLFAISFIIACAACIYLLSVAGKTANGIKLNFFDKVPAEINWVLGAGVAALAAAGAVVVVICEALPEEILQTDILGYEFTATLLQFASVLTDVIIGIFASIFFMIITGLVASLIRNIRNKSFWKHTLCYQLLRFAGWLLKNIRKFLGFILKPFEKIFRKIGAFFKKQIDKIKYILACDYSKGQGTKFKIVSLVSTAAVLLLLLLMGIWAGMATRWGNDFAIIFPIVLLVFAATGLFAALIFVSLDRIMACVSEARNGKLDGKIDTKFMPPFMRRFAEDILSMQDGLQNAVESAVKDQRMKAELITNVSHDLKTPLTSIVNYVDLLKKCEVEDETAQRYINVLDEKAARMKKLIEDLVEASKASSGAIEIHPVKVNLCEFAAQAVGEHEDELKSYNIGLVLKAPPAPVFVTADSQKTSRIVENLFSNIRKYAMEGTRVYIEVADGTDYASIIFKNISKYPLDVSADELTQRFVRGDASRSGEGSGLGLSIAQNLCELQKGRFRVEIDGDLFKVTLSLPKTE